MYLSNELNKLRTNYNSEQKRVELKAKERDRNYSLYAEENKKKIIQDLSQETRAEYKRELSNLLNTVTERKKHTTGKIQAVKFPNLSDKEINRKIIGEQQITQAQIFLSSPKKSEQIISSINEALEMGRNEYAFTVINSILSAGNNVIIEPAQKKIIEQVKNIYDNSEVKKTIEPIEKELNEIELSKSVINDFNNQLESGNDFVIIPELWKEMSNEDRDESNMKMQTRGNLTDMIHLKSKISEVMNS